MGKPAMWIAVLAMLALAGPAAAGVPDGAPALVQSAPASGEAPEALVTPSCAPPCGYIVPQMDLVVEGKPSCYAGLGQEADTSQCIALPAPGASVSFDAVLVWQWEVSEDGTYPNDVGQDIEVTFQGTASNPNWLPFSVEPAAFAISTADLLNPTNLEHREKDGSDAGAIWFVKEFPVTVTFTRQGDPSPEQLQEAARRDGTQSVFLKVKSSASGERFKPSWYVEKFTFASQDLEREGVGDRAVPAPALWCAAGLVAAAALTRRRR